RKKVGRGGGFASPVDETLKTCDANKLTRQGEAAAGCASGTPHPPEMGEPIREIPHEFKGLVGMACPGAGSSATQTFTHRESYRGVDLRSVPAAARRGCRLSRGCRQGSPTVVSRRSSWTLLTSVRSPLKLRI